MASPKSLAPGPRGHFLLGNLGEFRSDVLGLIMRATAAHGDIVRCKLGPHVVHLLNHPEYAEQILQKRAANYDKNTRSSSFIRSITGESLLTSNGDAWKRERRMVQPAFHHQQIAKLAGKMADITASMLGKWRTHPPDTPLDISSEMTRLTYSVVGETLFSFETKLDAEAIERAMGTLLPHVFNRLGQWFNLPDWLPTPSNRRFRNALAEVDKIVYQIIERHRQEQAIDEGKFDLLTMLLQVRDEKGGSLTNQQLRNETITFLLAGHETTANALTWLFYLVAKHPNVEEQLSEEISRVLADRSPTLADISKLTYTQAVIKETMRLYPPIWIIERRVIAEDRLGGFTLPAGSSVAISPYAMHRHPGFWDRPDEFDPTRFLGAPPPCYLPFGLGPRFCIGNEFAMMEAQIVTALVIQSFQLQLVPGHPVEPMPGITLRAKHGMAMTLRRR
jgi:enediyne biosynthesis protein E7